MLAELQSFATVQSMFLWAQLKGDPLQAFTFAESSCLRQAAPGEGGGRCRARSAVPRQAAPGEGGGRCRARSAVPRQAAPGEGGGRCRARSAVPRQAAPGKGGGRCRAQFCGAGHPSLRKMEQQEG